jgi:hypothetical protein
MIPVKDSIDTDFLGSPYGFGVILIGSMLGMELYAYA